MAAVTRSKCQKLGLDKSTFVPPNKLEDLNDIIESIEKWEEQRGEDTLSYTDIEYTQLKSCLPYIKKINDMIGMKDFKKKLARQLIYFSQGMHRGHLNNIIITGSPGCGKSTVCEYLSKIYFNMGVLMTDKIHSPTKSDLIAGYLGQTAILTNEYLKNCLDGVLFIDEAYSLGATSKDANSYSIECIDAINRFLTEKENKDRIVCIMAGYKKDIEEKIFPLNKGFESRFPWRFHIDPYDIEELVDIFIHLIKRSNWDYSFKKDEVKHLFERGSKKRSNIEKKKEEIKKNDNLLEESLLCSERTLFRKAKEYKAILEESKMLEDYINRHDNEYVNKDVAKKMFGIPTNKIENPIKDEERDYFINNGRDCEKLLSLCKMEHGYKLFTKDEEYKKNNRFCLDKEDIENGFKKYIPNTNKEYNRVKRKKEIIEKALNKKPRQVGYFI